MGAPVQEQGTRRQTGPRKSQRKPRLRDGWTDGVGRAGRSPGLDSIGAEASRSMPAAIVTGSSGASPDESHYPESTAAVLVPASSGQGHPVPCSGGTVGVTGSHPGEDSATAAFVLVLRPTLLKFSLINSQLSLVVKSFCLTFQLISMTDPKTISLLLASISSLSLSLSK